MSMKKQLLYIIFCLSLTLLTACVAEHFPEEEGADYMQLNTQSKGGGGVDELPCFIFWTNWSTGGFYQSDGTLAEPFIYSKPPLNIDDYSAARFNTGYRYPQNVETVYAVGIWPRSIMPPGDLGDISDWNTFDLKGRADAGLVDIQCAPVIWGTAQNQFDNTKPLKFEHQLVKLEFMGYCGVGMWEGSAKHIYVKDLTVTIRSDQGTNQWELFPEQLVWSGVSSIPSVGQYVVEGYTSEPGTPISASLPKIQIPGNTSKAGALPIGNFYLMPGFEDITVYLEAIYVDTTSDGKTEHTRTWELLIEGVGDAGGTEAGYRYPIFLGFEKSQIVLSATIDEWEEDEHN